jgi:hypothetical protein
VPVVQANIPSRIQTHRGISGGPGAAVAQHRRFPKSLVRIVFPSLSPEGCFGPEFERSYATDEPSPHSKNDFGKVTKSPKGIRSSVTINRLSYDPMDERVRPLGVLISNAT